MDKRHIVVAGGGTGGHLFPGVAVVEALEEIAGPDVEFAFVGAERGIEARAIPKLGYPIRLLDVKPLKAGGALGMMKGAMSLPIAGAQATKFLFELKPDLVLAVGGYAAGPFTAMAAMRGVKTALMEQNALPGLTNRWLGRLVDRAYLSFASTESHFPRPRCKAVGNPIRKKLRDLAADFQYRAPEGQTFHLLIVGGSGGAHSLNVGVPEALKRLPENLQKRLHVTHQAGRGRTAPAVEGYEGFLGNVDVVEFIDDMADAYASTNLLICRAGMSTIAEVTALGLPAVYVPLPTGDGHQIANAREIVDADGGMMVDNGEVGSEATTELIAAILNDPRPLVETAANARKLGRPEAAEVVARDILEWLE